MQLRISRKTLVTILASLCLIFLSIGLYFFFKQDPFSFKIPKLDRYTDVKDWCEYTNDEGVLNVKCKALLLEITNDEDSNSCFNMLIISKDKELKDLTICEPNSSITYTNEVLGYKKLMPINISFNYSKKDILNDYVFSNVSFEPMDEEYIHSIVNEDIARLVQTDVESMTTIKNSINFCPKPNTISSNLTDENKDYYLSYYNVIAMNQTSFKNGSLYDLGETELNIVFGCESQIVSGYTSSCPKLSMSINEQLDQALQLRPNGIKFERELKSSDIPFLKEISVLYDGSEFFEFKNKEDVLLSIIGHLNTSDDISEELYCSTYRLLESITSKNTNLSIYASYMKSYINQNIVNIQSGMCRSAIDTTSISTDGLYIKSYYDNLRNSSIFSTVNSCINLASIYN